MPSLWQRTCQAERFLNLRRALGLSVFCVLCCIFTASPSQAKVIDPSSPPIPGALHVGALRTETEQLFYHGFDNYMEHAFPEDELRPLTCRPRTRDRDNPAHFEVNDVLGNYTLTLVDSLSTLAILSSQPRHGRSKSSDKAFKHFQDGIKKLVDLYGDGTVGGAGQGTRARGFDLDSKVQVFETAIRGVGGLLSAHLFAVGDLPIGGYHPDPDQVKSAKQGHTRLSPAPAAGILWQDGFHYNGQLLRLAHDMAERLLPAFWTSTGIPYPRVNLRHGTPFYANSAGNFDPEYGQCDTEKQANAEITETCSAGAGSLVLEFTVLSRLTGDPRFEDLAKRAFWSIWNRRSEIDLIGAGIDAETGVWQHSWTGIGAGIDSFFEYAFKSHVLLSQQAQTPNTTFTHSGDPRQLLGPLSESENSPATFLRVWEEAHSAIKRHIYRSSNFQHPHYIQVDISTGAARAFWVDALSAYYPGLLALSGYIEEAVETHMVATALWTRYSAIPERYNMITGGIEGGLGWWVGRPEFIESNYYLYRATKDPWYIYVGEMALRDIKRRCWTRCGWASIQNVLTGELSDRMESFFLGETAKYLFLLFDPDHPLNKLDAPFVFSTEGHPLIIPRDPRADTSVHADNVEVNQRTCPVPEPALPFTLSRTAARGDIYHAASLARLHLMPQRGQLDSVLGEYAADHPSITTSDLYSPSNYTFYPWTLPLELIPANGVSTPMPVSPTFDLTFPTMPTQATQAPLQRVKEGVLINLLGGLRLSMIQDVPLWVDSELTTGYRIHAINNVALGKDEKVFLAHRTGHGVLNPQDPHFTRVQDPVMLDIVVDVKKPDTHSSATWNDDEPSLRDQIEIDISDLADSQDRSLRTALQAIISQLSSFVGDKHATFLSFGQQADASESGGLHSRYQFPAITPSGPGAAPIPEWPDAPSVVSANQGNHEAEHVELQWSKVYLADDMCGASLPLHIAQNHQVVVAKRGGCSFAKKLSNIPATQPSPTSTQLLLIVDYDAMEGHQAGIDGDFMTRPLLDELQRTSDGSVRPYPMPMLMVGGGGATYEALGNAAGVGLKRRYSVSSQGIPIANLMIL